MQSLLQVQSPNGTPISILPLGDGGNYYAAPPGTAGKAIAVPPGARFVLVTSTTADVWLRAGTTSGLTVTAPSGESTNGTTPALLGAGASQPYVLNGVTYLALLSTGDVRVEFFS